MTRALSCALILLLVAAAAGDAAAQKRRRKNKPVAKQVPSPADEEPRPGTCRYEREGSTVKHCYAAGGTGEFTVTLSSSSQVRVQLDVPLRKTASPEEYFIKETRVEGQHGRQGYVVYVLARQPLPKDATAILDTDISSITLHFEEVSGNADSQVHIHHLDRSAADAMVEKRYRARAVELEAEYKERHAALDREAERLARNKVLDAVFTGGASIRTAGGPRRARHDFITLHTGKVFRWGKHEYLYVQLEVENRKNARIELSERDSFEVWLERGGKRGARLAHKVRCSKTVLHGGAEATCVIAVTRPSKPADTDRLRVRVRQHNGDRAVELGGIDVR